MCDYAKQEIYTLAAQLPDELDPKALFDFVFEMIVIKHPECAGCPTESMRRITDMIALNRINAAARESIACGKALTLTAYKAELCRFAQRYTFTFFQPNAVDFLLGERADKEGPPGVEVALEHAGLVPALFERRPLHASG